MDGRRRRRRPLHRRSHLPGGARHRASADRIRSPTGPCPLERKGAGGARHGGDGAVAGAADGRTRPRGVEVPGTGPAGRRRLCRELHRERSRPPPRYPPEEADAPPDRRFRRALPPVRRLDVRQRRSLSARVSRAPHPAHDRGGHAATGGGASRTSSAERRACGRVDPSPGACSGDVCLPGDAEPEARHHRAHARRRPAAGHRSPDAAALDQRRQGREARGQGTRPWIAVLLPRSRVVLARRVRGRARSRRKAGLRRAPCGRRVAASLQGS